MKFIQMMNGDYINADEIQKVNHEQKKEAFYSFLFLKDGSEFDFLECPKTFVSSGKEIEFDAEHLMLWHKHALNLIGNSKSITIDYDFLVDNSFEAFSQEFERLQKK